MKNLCILITLFIATKNFGQVLTIDKILETNLFQLSNEKLVKLYGLTIPNMADTNAQFLEIAKELLNWENSLLAGRSFYFNFEGKYNDSINLVSAYKERAVENENIAGWLLNLGFAYITPGIKLYDYQKLADIQLGAQNRNSGIWKFLSSKDFLASDDNLERNKDILKNNVRSEYPNLIFMAISASALVLAWDSFCLAGDVQDQIDAVNKLNQFSHTKTDTSPLEKMQTRKYVVGVACVITAVLTTLFALKPVEIKPSPQGLSLSWNF
jgi:endonuclease YncB( thermonuclease family)